MLKRIKGADYCESMWGSDLLVPGKKAVGTSERLSVIVIIATR